MKMNLEIVNQDDVIVAQRVLSAYIAEDQEKVDVAEKTPAKKPVRKTATKKEVEEEIEDEVEEKPAKKPVKKKAAAKITVKSLQELAKSAIAESDKETVKGVISEYGANISSIDESDYEEFKAKLEELIEEV